MVNCIVNSSFTMIRLATPNDLETIMTLFDHSRSIMRSNGNHTQWVNGYPSRCIIMDDMTQRNCYVVEREGNIVGTFAFIVGRDSTYSHIEGGSWIDDSTPYGTIHRLACAPEQHSIGRECIEWCGNQVASLRADTHADNSIMQHILQQQNFIYCGIIYVADGTPRKAYQKIIHSQVNPQLRAYIEQHILPRHDHFDEAHQRDHILTVIAHSMDLAKHYEVDYNMTYTIAAYHDTGIVEGRERHHIVSGEIMRTDPALREWFSSAQIETMAQAVEDHRASATRNPRSIYGMIVAEADRDIDCDKILLRTIQYTRSHFPDLDAEGSYQRTLSHLKEKYAEGGYLKLFLPQSPNATKLSELRTLIADESKLRKRITQLSQWA